ncbi:MAG: BatD family protein [Candidatus Poribacteria bacterium]|nr:BatD family protein [Candidatus Poribacteria bacterium]MDE0482465.1 BatD family protein [Candidatus Poribacteria bacterium]
MSLTLFSILLMLFTTGVQSQDVKVAAVVTPRHIQFNEKATLELTISGNAQMKHIGSPTFNFLPDFLAVPLHSKTTPRLIDDKIAVTMAWAYELIPQKIGEIVLSDVQFSYQGVPYLANPGKIIVAAVDTYVNNTTGGIHKVQIKVSNPKPYLNEAIEYRFRYLYTTVLPSLEPLIPSLPEFTNFLVEELPNEKGVTVQIQGKKFQVQEYVRRLYPQKTGQILIQPAQLKLPIKGNPKTLKTKSVPLNVQPLPEVGKPANFTGAVGKYSITTQVDRRKLEVRQALTLSLQITGSGNVKTVTPPKIPAIKGFRINSQNLANTTNSNTNVYTYALTPLKAGILQIPAIEYVFFNPTNGTYQTTQTTPIPITVLPNANDMVESESDFPSWILWLLLLIPIFLGVGGYLLYRAKFKSDSESTTPDTPMTPAAKAFSALNAIDSDLTDANSSAFGEALTRSLHQYLCERQDIPYRQLNPAEVQEICTQVGVSTPILKELIDILTKCDHYRFAPIPFSVDEQKSLISRAETVIQHIEKTNAV